MLRNIRYILRLFCFSLLAYAPIILHAQPNYVRTMTPRVARIPSEVSALNSLVTTYYYDTAGREVETVVHEGNGLMQDLVGMTTYDSWGRKAEAHALQPFAGVTGSYRSRAEFTNADMCVSYGYEDNILGRAATATGLHTTGKSVRTEYVYTDYDYGVLRFGIKGKDTLVAMGVASYPHQGTRTTDEDGNVLTVFKDIRGLTVLERRGHEGEDEVLDTYYVYDDACLLRMVLPPMAVDGIGATGQYAFGSTEVLRQYAYLYDYDARGNRISTWLPCIDACYAVYDGDGRPVLSQTPKQRERGEWSFMRYDGLGRLTMQGTVREARSHTALVSEYKDRLVRDRFDTTKPWGYDLSDSLEITEVQIVNYYDDYAFLQLPEFGMVADADTTQTVLSQKMQTGYYVAALGRTQEEGEQSVYAYDQRGRLIRTWRYNGLTGITVEEETSYDHLNAVVENETHYKLAGGKQIIDRRVYTYNLQAQEQSALQHVSYTTEENEVMRTRILRNNTFDAYGRVTCSDSFQSPARTTYSYTEKGVLSSLNNPYFSQTLHYGEKEGRETGSYYYNGRISSTDITQGGRNYTISHSYDPFSRYDASTLQEESEEQTALRIEEMMSYDKMGNILHSEWREKDYGTLRRWHEYAYSGNQIETDTYYEAKGNSMPLQLGTKTYAYDANGNETSNDSSRIAVCYNVLNLPDTVHTKTTGEELVYTYMADGRKVRVERTGMEQQEDELWEGNLMLRNGRPEVLMTDGGYYALWSDSLQTETLRPYYFVSDYLGSVRAVVDGETKEVVQSLEYLPSGKVFRSQNLDRQPWQYTGKENQSHRGWDMYDSTARYQHAAPMRFLSIDPLAEKYYALSPYNYAGNDPINRIDPLGRDGILIVHEAEKSISVHAKYYVISEKSSANNDYLVFSRKRIRSLNQDINGYLNKFIFVVSEGEYEGYVVTFDLYFYAGGDLDNSKKEAGLAKYEGYPVGNVLTQAFGTYESFTNDNNLIIGGLTDKKYFIVMNRHYATETRPLVHEIFHTLGVSHPEGGATYKGVMQYPAGRPTTEDINHIIYNPFININHIER